MTAWRINYSHGTPGMLTIDGNTARYVDQYTYKTMTEEEGTEFLSIMLANHMADDSLINSMERLPDAQ